jgi:hypothetical protein
MRSTSMRRPSAVKHQFCHFALNLTGIVPAVDLRVHAALDGHGQHAADPFAAGDAAGRAVVRRIDSDVRKALTIPFSMIVLDVLAKDWVTWLDLHAPAVSDSSKMVCEPVGAR